MVTWDEQTDVIIVGSGVAGLSAAIEARQVAADVIVLEKMKVTGGNTRISDGGLAAPGNPIQKKLGIEDSAELFYQDILRAGLGLNHPHLVRIVAERSEEAINWTMDVLGVNTWTVWIGLGGTLLPGASPRGTIPVRISSERNRSSWSNSALKFVPNAC